MKKDREFYSPMPAVMVAVMLIGLAGCGAFAMLYGRTGAGWMLSCAITCGVIAYHMLIRFLAPGLLVVFTRRRYDYHHPWFRPRRWEQPLYERLGVQQWKQRVPSWDPSQFSLEVHTLEEIACNMCHAELVHELIALLSFTSLFFAIPFGAFPVFLITAALAAMFDGMFAVVQRYNRPRIVMILDRRAKRVAKA